MSNKHIFYELSRTHLHYSIVRSGQRPKVNEFVIMEVDKKKLYESEWYQKLKFKIKY